MTYQKDQTGILQSATKAAAELTSAELAAGIIKSHETAVKRFDELRAHVLVDLAAAVEADNAMFKAEEAASGGSSKGSSRKSSGGGGGGSVPDDPGSVVIKGKGKFTGKTVQEVFDMPASVAEDYGYVDKQGNPKPGASYIDWLTTNEKNPFMQRTAVAFLEKMRATSDAA